MDTYELRPVEGGFELSGGKLAQPTIYRETEPAPAIRLVGFLSQKDGSELRMFDLSGELMQTRRCACRNVKYLDLTPSLDEHAVGADAPSH